ncbi:MAG: hypothetical protein ABIN80_28560 [Dyadobacter sp.]|uniref:hypothetical protein n=1 Tax=Dyadobacter sp. TaxID=1914288 RepID=UPI003267C2BE
MQTMKYFKEVTDAGLSYYYAQQPDYSYVVSVAIAPSGLINAMRFATLPPEHICKPIEREEFAKAFNKATETFTDFLNINP